MMWAFGCEFNLFVWLGSAISELFTYVCKLHEQAYSYGMLFMWTIFVPKFGVSLQFLR